jgi:glycosyltransferase involved in cell wall biosynthesis
MATPLGAAFMKTSVIFTTYNSPAWLEKVLWGFFEQTVKDFEIVIADDGSRDDTRQLIDRLRGESPVPIEHVWQEDAGFQKCRILNKAIVAAKGEYLIFTDGDCIPRADFVEQHLRLSEYGTYLSGGYFLLPMDISQTISRDDIIAQRAFDLTWLRGKGLPKSIKDLKLSAKGVWASLLNQLSRTRPTWNGHNASCHKEFALAVNGFEEQMQYGGQDREFGDRLAHLGLKSKRIRYSAVCVHLDHKRGYVTEEMLANSLRIRELTRTTRRTQATLGIDQYLPATTHLAAPQ